MFRPYYGKGILIGLFILVYSLISVGMPYFYKLIIDDSIANKNFLSLIKWISVIICLLLSQEIIYIIQVRVTLLMRKDMFSKLRKDLYLKLMTMSQRFYAKTHSGRLLTRITSDIDALQNLMLEKFVYLIQNILISIFIMVIITFINYKMLLITLFFVPVLFMMYFLFSKKIMQYNKDLSEKNENLISTLKEDFSLVKVIQSFSVLDFHLNKADEKINEMEDAKKALSFQYTKSASSTIIINILGIIVIWGYGGYEVIQGGMSIGTLVAISFYLNYIQNLFFKTYYLVMDYKAAIPSAERVFEIFDMSPDVEDFLGAKEIPKFDGSIEFENVSFSYEQDKPLLTDVNLTFNKNEIIAIIGKSGAGKTTLTNLIPRFYDVEKGNILINGCDIKAIKLENLRKNIAIVPQEDYLFNISIRENIILGRKNITDKMFEDAVALSGVNEFAQNNKKKYDEIIGENGINLSGGQRKRILIARAILENPYIMIFDEATANLDPESEALVLDSIKKLSKNRIIIFISHKTLPQDFVDRIIVINQGRILARNITKAMKQ